MASDGNPPQKGKSTGRTCWSMESKGELDNHVLGRTTVWLDLKNN